MSMKCDDIAIVEEIVGDTIANSVSPGFVYGRSGSIGPSPAWFLNNEVPSNITGLPFGLANGKILSVWLGSENVDTYDVEIYEHEGDEINLTLLATLNIVATRTKIILPGDPEYTHSADPSQFKQIAVRLKNGTTKNPKCNIFLGGTT